MVRNRLYPSLVSGASLPGTSDKAPLPHPAYLDGSTLLDDHGHSPVTVCELEHALVGNAVLLDVVLHEVHPAPLGILLQNLSCYSNARITWPRGGALTCVTCRDAIRCCQVRFVLGKGPERATNG